MTRTSLAAMVRALAATLLVASIAGCATEPRTTYGPPGGPAGALTDATESLVIAALGGVGLPAAEAQLPYRPTEGALLANAPRTVIQATLPEDPTGGFVVVYALQSPQAAGTAAAEQAALIASNRGGMFSRTARFSIRVVGSTVVYFEWIPETAIDQRTRSIEEAMLSVGEEVPVAR